MNYASFYEWWHGKNFTAREMLNLEAYYDHSDDPRCKNLQAFVQAIEKDGSEPFLRVGEVIGGLVARLDQAQDGEVSQRTINEQECVIQHQAATIKDLEAVIAVLTTLVDREEAMDAILGKVPIRDIILMKQRYGPTDKAKGES
jgi:hypothetical protein